jgi:hypothetical protein
MRVDDQRGTWLVKLAEAGHRRALDQLVELYLPLVYNILGHALTGSGATEDVVERLALETTVRVAEQFDGLPDRTRMRAWFAAAALEQARELRDAPALSDGAGAHSADFIDVTVARLKLTGQRRDLAEATRWLNADDWELLPLWWLEETGVLARGDVETALDLGAKEANEQVEGLRERIDAARRVVRILKAGPPCADLIMLRVGWDGTPDPEWRDRLHGHVRICGTCRRGLRLAPAGLLLTGLAPVPPPVIAEDAETPADGAEPPARGRPLSPGARPSWYLRTRLSWDLRMHHRFTQSVPARRMVVGAVAAALSALLALVLFQPEPAPPLAGAGPTAEPVPAATHGSPAGSAPAPPPPVDAVRMSSVPPSAPPTRSAYGSNVDGAESAPPYDRSPAQLPGRATGATVTAVGGNYELAYPRSANAWKITHSGDTMVLRGTGYFTLQWGIYAGKRIAPIAMPTWTGLRGRLFHVASGGGHRMDDTRPPSPGVEPGATWMGQPSTGFCTLPSGAQQMWQNEHYYLDGEVVLHNNENNMDYDLAVAPTTADGIRADITMTPNRQWGRLRYGVARDTGDDTGPVPQYVTREDPNDQGTVPQRSRLS